MRDPYHYYSVRKGEEKHIFLVSRLWVLARNLPVKKIPLDQLRLKRNVWFHRKRPHVANIIRHIKKAQKAKLKYPIILNAKGTIMDGHHRVLKAILKDRKSIKAVQFDEDPLPDFVVSVRQKDKRKS